MRSLPKLPSPLVSYSKCSWAYTDAQMEAYGTACYNAALFDGKDRIDELRAALAAKPVPMTEPEIDAAYLAAPNQHLRRVDKRLAVLIVRAIEAHHSRKLGVS